MGVVSGLFFRELALGVHYSAFVSGGTVGHEGGELLVRDTLSNINEMFA